MPQLKVVSAEFLRVLDAGEVNTVEDLEALAGSKIDLGVATNPDSSACDFMQFSLSPSNENTQAITASYIIPGAGTPVETKINKTLGYSTVTIKLGHHLAGYVPFATDNSGNMVQSKMIHGLNYYHIRRELEKLAR